MKDDIVHFIDDYTQVKGYSPSYREIAAAVGLKSISSVVDYLNQLQSEGRITYGPRIARSVRVVESEYDAE